MAQLIWTEEQIEQATEMWANKESAQAIADAIGKSRNAVIGKMNRMNIKRRGLDSPSDPDDRDGSPGESEAGPAPADSRTTPSTDVVNPDVLFAQLKDQRLPLMYLTSRTCRWPIGDPSTKNFWFCGKQSAIDKPYCAEHSELAFQNAPRTGAPDNSNTK